MGRRDLKYWKSSLAGGINEQADLANPDELQVARNVWAPDGKLVKRPGSVAYPIFAISPNVFNTNIGTDAVIFYEDPIGTYSAAKTNTQTLTMTNLPKNRYIYVGLNSTFNSVDIKQFFGMQMYANSYTPSSVATVFYTVSYWNGVSWAPITIQDGVGAALDITTFTYFTPGQDWTQTTINGQTKYFLRWGVHGATLSAEIVNDDAFFSPLFASVYDPSNFATILAAKIVQIQPTKKQYVAVSHNVVSGANWMYIYGKPSLTTPDTSNFKAAFAESLDGRLYPPVAGNITVVPTFGKLYTSAANYIFESTSAETNQGSSLTTTLAQVESDPILVGRGGDAPYDPDKIDQLQAFPRAKYTLYSQQALFVFNLDQSPTGIRWSAPGIAYKVWPTVQGTFAVGDDTSAITGCANLNEQPVFFKQASIWQMIDTGAGENNLRIFEAKQIISGVGCVSHNSIQSIRGELIFQARDGIYAFDGVSVRKVSEIQQQKRGITPDKLVETLKRVTASRREFSVAIHWKEKSCYLLALSLDGSKFNNAILVWDYKNDSWWLWDGIEPVQLFSDELETGETKIYYMDRYSRTYLLSPTAKHDNGTAIDVEVLSQRIPFFGSGRIRNVGLKGHNTNENVTVTVRMNDEDAGVSSPISTTLAADKDWGEVVFNRDDWSTHRRVSERLDFLRVGNWGTVSLTQAGKSGFEVAGIEVGLLDLGKRT